MSNEHEDRARQVKAAKIVVVLRAKGVTADEARTLDAAGRSAAERLAVVNPGSTLTWEQVASVMDAIEADEATRSADPFVGLSS